MRENIFETTYNLKGRTIGRTIRRRVGRVKDPLQQSREFIAPGDNSHTHVEAEAGKVWRRRSIYLAPDGGFRGGHEAAIDAAKVRHALS